MKSLIASLSIALSTTLVCAPAVAQTRFCVGGDLDHLSASDKASCNATLQAVRTTASALHAPDGWHFVVVCGEDGWKQYAAFSAKGEDALADVAADTDLQQHETFFREERLHTAQPHSLQRAVAHEVAAIVLKTNDEKTIQVQLAAWERKTQTQEALLSR